ncbi:MAG: transposase [Terriglobales bacterium]
MPKKAAVVRSRVPSSRDQGPDDSGTTIFQDSEADPKRYRSYPLEFKLGVVRDHLGGESMYSLAKRHKLSRNLIRTWVAKSEAGELGQDARTAAKNDPDLPRLFAPGKPSMARLTPSGPYEARIAELERMIGRQALEIEILREALERATEAGARVKAGRKPS